jgi:rod shape-determining protein MreD
MKVAVKMRPSSGLHVESQRVSPLIAIVVAVVALLVQSSLALWFPSTVAVDMALLVTVYLGLTRRSQIVGMLYGAFIGLAQDSLGHGPIGLYGIVKTVVGYSASSLGSRMDSDHPGIRLLATFGFYYVHLGLFLLLQKVLLERPAMNPGWRSVAIALLNAVVGVLLYQLLDRLRRDA